MTADLTIPADEQERGAHALAVDLHERLVGVLLDDREEVVEQLELARGQLVATERRQRRGASSPPAGCSLSEMSAHPISRRSYSR